MQLWIAAPAMRGGDQGGDNDDTEIMDELIDVVRRYTISGDDLGVVPICQAVTTSWDA